MFDSIILVVVVALLLMVDPCSIIPCLMANKTHGPRILAVFRKESFSVCLTPNFLDLYSGTKAEVQEPFQYSYFLPGVSGNLI